MARIIGTLRCPHCENVFNIYSGGVAPGYDKPPKTRAGRVAKSSAHAVMRELAKVELMHVLAEVEATTKVNRELICSRRRASYIVHARHMVWRRLRKEHGLSYPHIATIFDVDHTTVMAACKKGETK